MNLYYLGPNGTYSESAAKKALKLLNGSYIPKPVSTIAKVIELTDKESGAFAVIPIENSIEGIVRQSIDCLYSAKSKIRAQLDIKIEHCLASRKKDKKNIKHIISHPQALAQSSNYILENFNESIDLINSNSTAHALNSLLNLDETYAAIGSSDLAEKLNLNIIDKNIGDIKDNKTRFVLISKQNIKTNKETRTTIVFNTKNEPGALLKILEIFKKYNLNLVYLESRPSKKIFGEYNFFSDIDKGYEEIKEALDEIQKECNFYKMLGSYCVYP